MRDEEVTLDPEQLAAVRDDHDGDTDPERFLLIEVVARVGFVGRVGDADAACTFIRDAALQRFERVARVDWRLVDEGEL